MGHGIPKISVKAAAVNETWHGSTPYRVCYFTAIMHGMYRAAPVLLLDAYTLHVPQSDTI